MAHHATDALQKKQLLFLCSKQGVTLLKQWMELRPTIADLIATFPSVTLPLHVLVDQLAALQPRYYSVSSCYSGDASNNRLTVAFNIVDYTVENDGVKARRYGVCTPYLDALSGNSVAGQPPIVAE